MAARTTSIAEPPRPRGNATARLRKKDATRQQRINATLGAIAAGGFAELTLFPRHFNERDFERLPSNGESEEA